MENNKEMDAVKSLFTAMASDNLKRISKMIKGIREENRLNYLKASNPSNSHLTNVFKTAEQIEDYEVCALIKTLLFEREVQLPD